VNRNSDGQVAAALREKSELRLELVGSFLVLFGQAKRTLKNIKKNCKQNFLFLYFLGAKSKQT